MQQCRRCGAETQLYECGKPICVKCATELQRQRPGGTTQDATLRSPFEGLLSRRNHLDTSESGRSQSSASSRQMNDGAE